MKGTEPEEAKGDSKLFLEDINWFEKHLNWTYGIALIIGLIVLAVVGFVFNNAIGYIVYIVITFVGGELVLWRKNRFGEYPLLVLLPPIFAVVVLCVDTKEKYKLIDITLTPASSSNLLVGSTLQFTAIGTYLNDTTKEIKSKVTWSSSNPSVAIVNSKGLVICVGEALVGQGSKNGKFTYYAGNTNITASQDEITSTPVTLTVIRNN